MTEIVKSNVLEETITNSTNPDLYKWPKTFTLKGDFDPLLVKVALGNLVIVGDQIAYLNRIQIQSNAAPSSTPMPLDVKPSTLSFLSGKNGGTDGTAQPVVITNNGGSAVTSISSSITGVANAGDFALKPASDSRLLQPQVVIARSR